MRRLGAEEIRDSILWVTGTLNPAMGGPSIYTELPAEVLQTASRPDAAWGRSSPAERSRRSVYIFVKRSLLDPLLSSFDMADTDNSTAARFATTVPTQALTMVNGAFIQEQARLLARRLEREAGTEPAARVRRGLELVTQRPATAEEVARGAALIGELEAEERLPPARALELFCLMALNLNEFYYLD
jgi:hypothetical protein